jgi:H+/Cl- antiporter ClcA
MMSLSLLKKRLALPSTSWQLCLLAAIGGTASALLVVLFTFSIDTIQSFYLSQKDNYTSLDPLSRFDLPIVGGLVILFFAWLTGYKYLRTGIPFVLHRLKVANGVIPFRNTLNQFFGSVIALASGFSVGKEGPAVHLGAACSSYIGNKLNLPFNTIRTLCACGIAAGISACFNTPIAAVIFVMEVILREYKVHIFIPVMIASLIGSLITSSIFGTAHELEFFNKISLSTHHYPALMLLGLVLGLLAYGFNRYLVLIIKYSSVIHIVPRIMLEAFITCTLGYFVPFAMGTDLSAITFALENNLQLQ